MKYYTYWPIRSVLHFFDTKVSKKCNTNLIGQCEAPRMWLLQKRCRDAAVHFQNWVEQKVELSFSDSHTKSCPLKQCFTVSRTAELSSEGVSKLVLTLESIGSSENSRDEHVCETTEAWHGLACTMLLRSVFACMFGLVFRFSCHSICPLRYQKVSMCYGQQMLGWESLATRLIAFVGLVTEVQ